MVSKIKENNGRYDISDGEFKFRTVATMAQAVRAKARIDKEIQNNKPATGHRIDSPLGWSVNWPFTFPFEIIVDSNGTKKAAEDRILDSGVSL